LVFWPSKHPKSGIYSGICYGKKALAERVIGRFAAVTML